MSFRTSSLRFLFLLSLGSRAWAQSANDEFWPEIRSYFYLNQPQESIL